MFNVGVIQMGGSDQKFRQLHLLCMAAFFASILPGIIQFKEINIPSYYMNSKPLQKIIIICSKRLLIHY